MGVPRRPEPLHRPLTPACRLVGVLGSVVSVATLTVFHTWQHLPFRGPIAAKLVGDEHAWDVPTAPHKLPEELLGSTLVPAALHEDIQYVTFLIDCPPQVVPLPVDPQEHLVKVPLVTRPGTPVA